MEPITLAVIAAIKLIILVAVFITVLTFQFIIDWFQQTEELVQSDKDNIGITIKEHYEAGDYKIVQGIFNTRTNKVVEGRRIQSKKIDQKLDEKHSDQILVIYQ
jgi:hypothetical protein